MLVPLVGKETAFIQAIGEFVRMANGTLGWRGHAEMLLDLKPNGEAAEMVLGHKLEGDKEAKITKLSEWLEQAFWETILVNAEWLDKEAGEARWQALYILYGKTPDSGDGTPPKG